MIVSLCLAACGQQGGTEALDAPVTPDPEHQDSTACMTKPPEGPVMCTADWRPVCGCDGKTYANACNASAAGVTRHTEGECGEGSAD